MSEAARQALIRAKKRVGGGGKLANALGISPQAVSQWDVVPPLRVLQVESITEEPRHKLRPDLYPSPHAARRESSAQRAAQ